MTKLDQFINIDDARRDRAVRNIAVTGFVSFVILVGGLGIDESDAGCLTLGVIVITYIFHIWRYCSSGTEVRSLTAVVSRRRAIWDYAYAPLAAAIGFGLEQIVSNPAYAATVA